MIALKTTVHQLFLNTTLHGFRHLVEEKRHWFERLVWLLVQIMAMYGVATSINDVYLEYMSTPSVTSLETTQYPAWNVPFPAIGICNINKISRKKAMLLAHELSLLENIPHTKQELFEMLYNVGTMYDSAPSSYKGLVDLHFVLKMHNESIYTVLERLAPSCDSLMIRCRWKGLDRSCEEFFKRIATVNGFCCVFNILPPYDNNEEEEPMAEALQSSGVTSGLTLLVNPEPDDYYYPAVPTYGVQVMVFSPLNHPESFEGTMEYVAAQGREVFFNINVFSQFSAAELGSFSPLDRGCFFRAETNSRYTAINCLSSCMRKIINDSCSCLPYFVQDFSNTTICQLIDIPCLSRSKEKFQECLQEDIKDDGETSLCGQCLPACSNTWYRVQSSYAQISHLESATSTIMNGIEGNDNYTVLHLYYSTLDTTLYKQDVIYTRTELVSNFGGVFSLFNGFSFLSLVEILYFLTIRLFYIAREKRVNEIRETEGVVSTQIEREKSPYWSEMRSVPSVTGVVILY